MARNDKEQLFDCIITYGELDPDWYGKYKSCEKEVVKHNVTQQEAMDWNDSCECLKRVRELELLGREKFGKDYWMKWNVSHFWTTAAKDQP